jgi:hypothetical protein
MGDPWDFSDPNVTFDNAGFAFDGSSPSAPAPLPVGSQANLPSNQLQDVSHFWGQDLTLTSTGDLLLASGLQRSQQRILRRLNTNPNSYVGQRTYGGGLPQFIGSVASPRQISAVVTSQLKLEDSVAPTPPPVVSTTQTANLGALDVNIGYTDQPSNAPTTLAFTLGN